MLRKLMKYEFMATGRFFLPLFGALIIISAVNSILWRIGLSVPAGIGLAVSVILIIGIWVIVLLLTIQRFWSNLLSSEGYLMMTLPLGPDHLILSKLFVAAIWGLASSIVVFGSILIMAGTHEGFINILEAIREAFSYALMYIPFAPHQIALLATQFAIATILGAFASTLLIYACMSLSLFANKHRVLISFGAYIAITTVLQIIFTLLIAVGIWSGALHSFETAVLGFTSFGQAQVLTWIIIALAAIPCALFYLITRYMLKNRLNLQ
ncbi:MAG: hypothetical protein FWB97_02090 [Oscillospiraceae bacterium]|nr:hypothetical protein [Oscillospiraceae bacterium]